MAKGAEAGLTSGKQPKTRAPTQKTGKEPAKTQKKSADPERMSTRQQSEIRRLQKIYRDLPESQKTVVSKLIARAAYINSKLEET